MSLCISFTQLVSHLLYSFKINFCSLLIHYLPSLLAFFQLYCFIDANLFFCCCIVFLLFISCYFVSVCFIDDASQKHFNLNFHQCISSGTVLDGDFDVCL